MSNFFVLHGINVYAEKIFGKYLKTQIQALGGEYFEPKFPLNKKANYTAWENILDEYYAKGLINKDTTFICHSLSTLFFINWLVKKNIKIKTYISIAGFSGPPDSKTIPFLTREKLKKAESIMPISSKDDFKKFMLLTKHRYCVYSDNDHLFSFENLKSYADLIKGEHVFLASRGHFGRKAKTTQIPEVIEIIKSIK